MGDENPDQLSDVLSWVGKLQNTDTAFWRSDVDLLALLQRNSRRGWISLSTVPPNSARVSVPARNLMMGEFKSEVQQI